MIESKSIDENIDDFLKLVSGLSSVNVSVSEEVSSHTAVDLSPVTVQSAKKDVEVWKRHTDY